MTHSRQKAVDFSTSFLDEEYFVAVPVKAKKEIWSFLFPFTHAVWFIFLISIPTFMTAMTMADYFYFGFFKWDSFSFVLRIALVDSSAKGPDKYVYAKIFVVFWTFSIFVLTQSYAGTLTAMITRPGLKRTIREAGDMLKQEEFSWVMEDGLGVGEFMNAAPTGSTLKRLFEEVQYLSEDEDWYGGCHTISTRDAGKFASICDKYSIADLLSRDYRDVDRTCLQRVILQENQIHQQIMFSEYFKNYNRGPKLFQCYKRKIQEQAPV